MAPPKYGDFAKAADDLLNDDYFFDKKLKIKTKTANGYVITSEGVLKGDKNAASGKLTAKIPLDNGITLNKLGVTHEGRFILDAGYAKIFKGVSLTTLIEDGGKKPSIGELGATYKADNLTAKLKVDALNGPVLKGSVSTKYGSWLVGGEAKFNTAFDGKAAASSIKDYSAALAFVEKDVTVELKALKKLSQLQVSVHHEVNSDLQIGAVFQRGKARSMTFGSLYKLDKVTQIQGKVSSSGEASLNLIQKLTDNVKVIASSSTNVSDTGKGKFGLQFHLS